MMQEKPLGRKAYGHIPHLPGSRMTPKDHHCTEGQKRICTEKKRDKNDTIFITEKLDGSNVAIAKIDNIIIPLTRSGYIANTSKFAQHQYFFNWVMERQDRFLEMLLNGERLCGEWMAQAHGTRYILPHEPFVAFDLMTDAERKIQEEFKYRTSKYNITIPRDLNLNGYPMSIDLILDKIKISGHGAIDPVEGAVWRVERNGRVDFLAKFVRPEKIDGFYLPERNLGNEPIWNWKPIKN